MAQRSERRWDSEVLNHQGAHQGNIVKGDIVRSFDFPGSRDDCFVDGVVTEVREHTVMIHVIRDVFTGKDEQVGNRLEVEAPLGVGSNGAPGVFLVSKRVRQGDQ